MSETPTPSGGRNKRRGLALPPRGQALTRLQDLEAETVAAPREEAAAHAQEEQPVLTGSSNAVSTASSNAGVPPAGDADGAPAADARAAPQQQDAPRRPGRAAREPTTRITVDMPDSLHRRISFLSVEERRSIKDLVIEALERTYFRKGETGR